MPELLRIHSLLIAFRDPSRNAVPAASQFSDERESPPARAQVHRLFLQASRGLVQYQLHTLVCTGHANTAPSIQAACGGAGFFSARAPWSVLPRIHYELSRQSASS